MTATYVSNSWDIAPETNAERHRIAEENSNPKTEMFVKSKEPSVIRRYSIVTMQIINRNVRRGSDMARGAAVIFQGLLLFTLLSMLQKYQNQPHLKKIRNLIRLSQVYK